MCANNYHGVIIAGFGGQGVLSAGKLLAHAGIIDNKHVSWFPSYGPEMRGGTANCHVVISNNPVGSPVLGIATALIAMNRDSYNKFRNSISSDGFIFIDSSLINIDLSDTTISKVVQIPATRLASKMGNAAYANVILLGALIAKTGMATQNSIVPALKEVLSPHKYNLITDEIKAFQTGWEMV